MPDNKFWNLLPVTWYLLLLYMAQKILIVDDDGDFVEACRNLLEAAGYLTDFETEGGRVLEKIRSSGCDLVLLDILMDEELAGFQVAERMFADETLRKIPVVFLTGYFKRVGLKDNEREMLARWKNVRGILEKPVKPSIVLEMISKTLSA